MPRVFAFTKRGTLHSRCRGGERERAAMSARRVRWHPPPPPTPRILHFPRRSRIFRQAKSRSKSPAAVKPNLEELMRQESRRFTEEIAGASEEESWRFQAEVLRAECKYLRLEREVAFRRLDKNRAQMESAFRSAMEAMLSGRDKIDGRGGKESIAREEQIEEIWRKVEEIPSESRLRSANSGRNFDRRASVLRRNLETMEEDETSVKEIREVEDLMVPKEDKLALPPSDRHSRFSDVSINNTIDRTAISVFGLILSWLRKMKELRMKMEVLTKGMLQKMKEHRLFGAVADRSSLFSLRQAEGRCGNCRALVSKMLEQVASEAEQWGEMQSMLERVKSDMEDLRSSRDHWERRALSLHSQMLDWKRRALESDDAPPSDQLHSEIWRLKRLKIRENHHKSSVLTARRSPLRDIGNLPSEQGGDSAARLDLP